MSVAPVTRVLTTRRLLHVTEVDPPTTNDAGGGPGFDESRRPTFVLLHGYGGSSFTWRHWAPRLARRGRVLLVDLKGFGLAPKPDDGRYGPRDLADEVVGFLREHDLSRVTLVGHSLGGGVALLTALSMLDAGEERLERLVLVSAASYPQRLPPFVHLSTHPRLAAFGLRLIGARRVIRAVLRSIVSDRATVSEAMVRAYAAPLHERAAITALLAAGRTIVPHDLDALAARYPELRQPALVLWGRDDRVVPLQVGERLAAALPGAVLEVLEACGHIPPEERPDASWTVLEGFLDRTRARDGSAV